jgi:outer membrane lipoprotein-sorting protein
MIRSILAACTLSFGLALGLAAPASAQLVSREAVVLNTQQQADVARVNAYLNALSYMSGRFLQINPDGVLSEGAFYLARPGRARFDYDEEELVVVARGQKLLIKEGSFVTNELPLDGTPLKVLLGREVDVTRDARVISVDSRAGTLAITIQDPEAPELGYVTLIFTGADLQLQRWIVTDSQGLRTTVSLTEVAYPASLDRDLFDIESDSSTLRGRQN